MYEEELFCLTAYATENPLAVNNTIPTVGVDIGPIFLMVLGDKKKH